MRKLLDAGAPVLGKTNMDEFAMGSSNENSGFGPVQNPWDRERVPGGSSGGSAAAVAAGSAPWAIGTDTGGSIRQPAACCGIVGLKPTYGAVSRYGMIAFASSLDQAGPLTRDVTDAALLFKHMVGKDPCDSTSLEFPEEVALPTAERLDGVRFGVPPELTGEGIEDGVKAVFDQTLAKIEDLGGKVEEVGLPHSPHAIAAYYLIAPAEASANPPGMEIAGMPASGIGTVHASARYIAHGSAVRSPSLNATVGDVGVMIRSTFSNAERKSSAIFVRTRCARP